MKKKPYKIDLTKIDGDGVFQCPKCATSISPDDETENTYTIIETTIGENDCLESLTIQCKKCQSFIGLTGLAAIYDEGASRVEISEALSESKPKVRTVHTISLDGQSLCQLTIEYAQKEDVKSFKRLRKLQVGKPFKSNIIIMEHNGSDPEREDLQEIIEAVKRKFNTLKDNDIYLASMKKGEKTFLGRASSFKRSVLLE